MVNLGAMLKHGDGARASVREAASWFRRAWRRGRDRVAAWNLGLMVDPSDPRNAPSKTSRRAAIEWYRRAAQRGVAPAWSRLAWLLSSGRRETQRESVQAYLNADRAGELSAIGLYDLGLAFEYARGVKKNLRRAMAFYRRSAALGSADALVALGYNTLHGVGVRREPKQALRWYLAVAKQGDLSAHFSLGDVYATGLPGVRRNPKTALLHLRFAARRGHLRARALLHELEA